MASETRNERVSTSFEATCSAVLGPALEARFMELNGIAVAPDGTIYLADGPASRVRRIKDGVIETVAGDGEEAYTGDGGPGTEASLHYPTALELDALPAAAAAPSCRSASIGATT